MLIENFSEKQKEIVKFIKDENQILICDGSVRSGKTVAMLFYFLIWSMAFYQNQKFAFCSNTIGSGERNLIDPLLSFENLPFDLNYNNSKHVLKVSVPRTTTNYFHLFGGDDAKSSFKIQGLTAQGILFDEVALMNKEFVNQAIARTMQNKNKKLWFNCNPEGPNHWFYLDYISNKKPKTTYLHFTMQDNPILDEETIENAKKLYDGVFYKRYILGLWSVAEGAIYTIFLENKEKYFIENIPHKLNTQINIGLDFGGSESNHALTATATDLNSLYVIKSEVRNARNTTPEDIYAWVAQFVDEIESKYWKINVLYADNAEQTLINGLKSRINVRISDSIKENIVDRIRCTASLMASNRFFMIKNQCKDLITAFESAVWNSKKLNDERLDDGSYCVDILDSFEYSFARYIRQLSRKENYYYEY